MARKQNRDWSSLTAPDIMQTTVLTVSTNTPLSEVQRLLSEHRISGVPVTGETGHIVGVISMRDLIDHYSEDSESRPERAVSYYSTSSGELLEEETEAIDMPDEAEDVASEVMTAEVFTVAAESKLSQIAKKMVDLNIHRILVEDDKKIVGLITTMDILKALAD